MYTDDDPGYRNTPIYSGIPPPSIRDLQRPSRNYNDNNDLSRYNPQRQVNTSMRPDNSRYHPYQRQYQPSYHHQQQQPYPASSQLQPATVEAPTVAPTIARPARKLDMRTSTDFIECGKEEGSVQLSLEELYSSIQLSPSKLDYDFLCSSDLVKTAIELRDKGRRVPDQVRAEAKNKSNPFDCIGKHIFMNGDATKLAALDASFHLIPADDHSGKPFTFADLCGGPGGFSEYIFWRIQQTNGSARGYGITLQSAQDDRYHWQLSKLPSSIAVNFTQIVGIDGTGDLLQKSNILEFDAVVSNNTKKRGVDLVVADGRDQSINIGKDEQMEHLTKRLILCEVITMLTCLKQGGTFVCKFFDIFEEFTADLVWLLYQLFDCICITKPLTSEPTDSERYLVCKRLRFQHPTKLIDALLSVNVAFDDQEHAVGRFIPKHLIEKDEAFSDYVKMRNMKFLLKQIDALEQMETYIADPDRRPLHSQDTVKRQCSQEWRLPLITE